MSFLNYHHLRYFRAIALEGNLTRAAEQLHVSQSALSIQLRKLEESLGQALFERAHKTLVLTEAGRVALDYAETIFRTGDEMMGTLVGARGAVRRVLRVGSVSTLSRNFQLKFLRPLIDRADAEIVVESRPLRDLLGMLRAHVLDVVLANAAVPRDAETRWHSHLLDEQEVGLVGKRVVGRRRKFRFPEDLKDTPLLLPSLENDVRAAFDRLVDAAGVRPVIAAEVDDMAMLRLLARESDALALVPRVVVQDELREGVLVEWCRLPDVRERFYAITPTRRFPNPLVRELVEGFRGGR